MSSSEKITCLIHIYNEEYLLPFWLNYHKDIFDKIIVIDYRSTDKSIEICKKICPSCDIITTRNPCFGAEIVDKEIMDIESQIQGIKIVLNVTEFLFCERSIKEIFNNSNRLQAYSINIYSSYYNKFSYPTNNNELFSGLLNDVKYHSDRGVRFIHNYRHGNYTTGRHITNNPTSIANGLYIIWMGFYPMNEFLLERKLQIQNNIPLIDKQRGFGSQHLYTKEKILSVNNEKVNSGKNLKDFNLSLYNLISRYIIEQKNNIIEYKNKITINELNEYVLYPELYSENNWGENYVILDNDVNLLKNTDFDEHGYKIFDIKNYNNLLQTFIRNEIKFITNKEINLLNYHNEITDEEHTKILNSMPYKKTMYPDVEEFCIYLEKYISSIVGEPIKIFNDDIWFRICRPTSINDNDFNPCHRDVYLDFYKNILNIYLPVVGSNENSSLKIQAGSHKWNENDVMVTKGGAYFPSTNKKYSVDAIIASKKPIDMIRPNPSKSQMMLFTPYLIHGCADNTNNNMTRISLEIRFIRDDDSAKKQEQELNNFLKIRNWR
jgi:hypothetical protein